MFLTAETEIYSVPWILQAAWADLNPSRKKNYMYEEVPILPFWYTFGTSSASPVPQASLCTSPGQWLLVTLAELKTIVSSLNSSVELWTGFTHRNKAVNFFPLHPFSSQDYFCFLSTVFLYIHTVELSFITLTSKQITILKLLLQFLETMFKLEKWTSEWEKIH